MEEINSLHEFMGVKASVERGLDRLPHRFIRPVQERAVFSDDEVGENIPVIDLQRPEHENPFGLSPKAVEAIGRACHEWGCFQVVNHGIAPSTMKEMMEAAGEFFAQPEKEKIKHFSLDPLSTFRYASSFNLEKDKVLNWRDFIRYSCHPLDDVISFWPSTPSAFSVSRKASIIFCTQIHEVVHKLCAAIFKSLGLPEDYTQKEFKDYSQVIVSNYYPKCPDPQSTLGVGSHTDPGWITALMQDDVGGLQVFHGDRWIAAKPIPNALVVNLGDVFQIVSNGKYKSVEHRVTVNANRDRLSVLTTYGPSLNATIRPAPELLLKGCKPVYGEIVYKDYMHRILNGSLEDKRLVDFHGLEIENE